MVKTIECSILANNDGSAQPLEKTVQLVLLTELERECRSIDYRGAQLSKSGGWASLWFEGYSCAGGRELETRASMNLRESKGNIQDA